MPFTAEAVLLHHILENNGITAAGFCDNRESSHGKSYHGCEIMSPALAFELSPGTAVVLCSMKYYVPNTNQLLEIGFSDIMRIGQFLSEEDISKALNMVDSKCFLEIAPKQAPRLERLPYEIRTYIPPDAVSSGDMFSINAVEVLITERCTLKCKDCCNLMQYYDNPKHIDAEKVCEDIDLLFDKTDYISRLSIMGGEPMLHPGLSRILSHIMKYKERYGYLRIVTNGTITPTPETLRIIKESGIYVRISDYGELAPNVSKLTGMLAESGIPHNLQIVEWHPGNQLMSDGTSDAQAVFDTCTAKLTCNSLLNGRLYRCAFLASGENLCAFPYDERNHIDFKKHSLTRDDLKSYLNTDVAFPGCKYCNGTSLDLPVIPSAIQISKPRSYRRYAHS